MSWKEVFSSSRYWAVYNPAVAAPSPVLAWVDLSLMPDDVKPSWWTSDLSQIALTAAQWTARQTTGQGIQNGAIVAYTPPAAVVPLKTQATSAQAWIQQQANLAAAMGATFTADMKAYVLAINAIASGTDTTSTTLPAQPTDVMTATTTTGATT